MEFNSGFKVLIYLNRGQGTAAIRRVIL